MKNIVIASLIIIGTFFLTLSCRRGSDSNKSSMGSDNWDYETDRDLGVYSECEGKVQSPIDILTANTVASPTLNTVNFNYAHFPMNIIDNGHAIEVKLSETNNTISYTTPGSTNSTNFSLIQFHFHTPSEHAIDNKHTPLELHLVHQDPKTENLFVVGIFLSGGATRPSSATKFIDQIVNNIPNEKEKEIKTSTQLDINDILPSSSDRTYYTYTGSLTTPPCSQGVTFLLYKTPLQIMDTQLNVFKQKYTNNARPIQSLNNRLILEKVYK